MKTFLKVLPWAIIVVLVVIGYFFVRWDNGKSYYESNSEPPKIDVPIEKRPLDDKGVEHAIIQDDQNIISRDNFIDSKRPQNQVDSAAANLKIAKDLITKLTIINTLTRDSLLKAKKVVNTLNNQLSYVYKDKYVDLKFDTPSDDNKEGSFSFAYDADLNIVQYQKRKWFLGAKKSYIDISSNDTRTTIRGVRQLTIEQKEPQFGLRLQASTNYNFYTGNFGAGPGLRVDINRWSFQGNYMYYPSVDTWYPAITANFDIIRF